VRQLVDLWADEPIERLQAQGMAAVVYSNEDDWSVGLGSDECRTLAKRLLELAADHERRNKKVRS
jgi:hypothetical protein